MWDETKEKIVANIGVDIVALVYTILLCRYNKKLYVIQESVKLFL